MKKAMKHLRVFEQTFSIDRKFVTEREAKAINAYLRKHGEKLFEQAVWVGTRGRAQARAVMEKE